MFELGKRRRLHETQGIRQERRVPTRASAYRPYRQPLPYAAKQDLGRSPLSTAKARSGDNCGATCSAPLPMETRWAGPGGDRRPTVERELRSRPDNRRSPARLSRPLRSRRRHARKQAPGQARRHTQPTADVTRPRSPKPSEHDPGGVLVPIDDHRQRGLPIEQAERSAPVQDESSRRAVSARSAEPESKSVVETNLRPAHLSRRR